jgi:hypothetical protein
MSEALIGGCFGRVSRIESNSWSAILYPRGVISWRTGSELKRLMRINPRWRGAGSLSLLSSLNYWMKFWKNSGRPLLLRHLSCQWRQDIRWRGLCGD